MTALQDAIQESISPTACAVIIAYLQGVQGENDAADQARWFCDQIVELVGGPKALNGLMDEAGV